eukprot:1194259-Prorocentrum_minimum.AAC.2
MDKNATVYYMARTSGDPAPTSTEIIAAAAAANTTTGRRRLLAQLYVGSRSVVAGTKGAAIVSGLTLNTPADLYFTAVDTEGYTQVTKPLLSRSTTGEFNSPPNYFY